MEALTINPADYYVCFKWTAKVDYTQPIRRGSGRKNARKHSGVSVHVLGHNRSGAEFSVNSTCKKKGWKEVSIAELVPVGVSFGFLSADPEQSLPESFYSQIPMPA